MLSQGEKKSEERVGAGIGRDENKKMNSKKQLLVHTQSSKFQVVCSDLPWHPSPTFFSLLEFTSLLPPTLQSLAFYPLSMLNSTFIPQFPRILPIWEGEERLGQPKTHPRVFSTSFEQKQPAETSLYETLQTLLENFPRLCILRLDNAIWHGLSLLNETQQLTLYQLLSARFARFIKDYDANFKHPSQNRF